MKHLRPILVLALILSTTLAQAQWGKWEKVKGNRNITTETRSTGDYDGLKAAGPMDFKLVQGTEGKISIKGDSNLMEYIITEIKNNNLIVKVKDGYNIKPSETIIITIPYESLNYISLAGSGDIENSGTIRADEFKVTLSGSGDINLNINATSVESSIAGSGDIELNGSSTELTTKVTGSGDFDGDKLESTNTTVKITGSGSANVVCNGGTLKVRITGSGDVNYSGTPKNKDTKITGSGSVSN